MKSLSCGRVVSWPQRGKTYVHLYGPSPDLVPGRQLTRRSCRDSVKGFAAVFNVPRAYFHVEEKRDTFEEVLDCVPANLRVTHVGQLRKALFGTPSAAPSWSFELRKMRVSRLTVGSDDGTWGRRHCPVSLVRSLSRCCTIAGAVRGDHITCGS